MLMPLRGNRRRLFHTFKILFLRKGIIMLKYLNQELFKEELISDPATNYTDRCFTPPDFIEYDEEHPRPDKPFLKVREFSCENESDRKLNIRGILTKTGAELQTAQQLYNVGVDAVNANFHYGAFAFTLHGKLQLTAAFFNSFLNAGRVNASVRNQTFQCHAGNLTACLVKAG